LVYMAWSALSLGSGFELSVQGNSVLYGRTTAAADCATLHLTVAERAVCPSPATVRSLGGIDGLVNNPTSPAYTAHLPAGASLGITDKRLSYAALGLQPPRLCG